MGGDERGGEVVGELRAFLAFLKNLWGLLAGISIFFPFSSVLLRVIPLTAYGEEGGVFDHLAPALITTVATVVTIFVLLVSFTGRHGFRDPDARRRAVRTAGISFGSGIVSLIVYLVLHQVYREYAWDRWGWGSGDPRKLLAEVPLMLTYVGFFTLVTRGFVLLGMLEFFGARKD